jgi:hypothetical protein
VQQALHLGLLNLPPALFGPSDLIIRRDIAVVTVALGADLAHDLPRLVLLIFACEFAARRGDWQEVRA